MRRCCTMDLRKGSGLMSSSWHEQNRTRHRSTSLTICTSNAKFAAVALFLSTINSLCSSLNNCLLFSNFSAEGRLRQSGAIISLMINCNSKFVLVMGNKIPCRMSCHSGPFSGSDCARPRQISYSVAPREKISLLDVKNIVK